MSTIVARSCTIERHCREGTLPLWRVLPHFITTACFTSVKPIQIQVAFISTEETLSPPRANSCQANRSVRSSYLPQRTWPEDALTNTVPFCTCVEARTIMLVALPKIWKFYRFLELRLGLFIRSRSPPVGRNFTNILERRQRPLLYSYSKLLEIIHQTVFQNSTSY